MPKNNQNRGRNPQPRLLIPGTERSAQVTKEMPNVESFEKLPVTFQELNNIVEMYEPFNPFPLRQETMKRIERATKRPLVCYVAKTSGILPGQITHIEDSDLVGFDDLVQTTDGPAIDVFLTSNGGSAEVAERIVKLLRSKFELVRFIIPANAYSAATLICLSGDEIIMDALSTLGPIDPQLGGIPTRAILRSFEEMKEKLKIEGPSALTAYMPLIAKYDLHILEMCKSAEELSAELAADWLSRYMLKCDIDDERVNSIVDYFASYDRHKSHSRSIDRVNARDLGLSVVDVDTIDGLPELVRSLRNQFAFWFEKTPFFKMFENTRGINWGRQSAAVQLEMPQAGTPPQR